MGKFGFPKGDVQSNSYTGITWQEYEHGFILGSERTGFYESSGKIREAWAQSGYEMGVLGFPTDDVVTKSGITSQRYEGGVISCGVDSCWIDWNYR